jgi:microcystin-dependent protein
MAEPFLGEISITGFDFNPWGWAKCDGQLLPIAQNSALFSLLGTIYGGDGETTFALPGMRGRAPVHFGQGPGLSNRPLGQRSGSETASLATSNIPSHTHNLNIAVSAGAGTQSSPVGGVPASTEQVAMYRPAADANDAGGDSIDNAGSSAAHENMPPFQTVNFNIALVGLFPSDT